jgi:hypothetical protein
MKWVLLLVGLAGPLAMGQEVLIRLPKASPVEGRNLIRDAARYFLLGMVTGELPDEDSFALDEERLPPGLQALVRERQLTAVDLYAAFKKPSENPRLFADYRDRTRERWHRANPIPDTLKAFRDKYPFDDEKAGWNKRTIKKSAVKQRTRVIYRKVDANFSISLSQTHETVDGNQNAPVRETEIAIRREGVEDWDYFVYDREGNLADTSTFSRVENVAGVAAPSPVSCLTCHYDPKDRHFVEFPSVDL